MSGAIIGGGIAAAGGLASGLIGANAAGNAASTQADTARYNAQIQAELGQEQLGFEAGQYGNTLNMEMPWLQSGANNLASLNYLLGQGSPNQNPTRTFSGPNPVAQAGTASLPAGTPQSGALRDPYGAQNFSDPSTWGANGAAKPASGTNLSIPGVSGSVNVPSVGPIQGQANTNLGAYGSLLSPYPGGQFQAPTAEEARQTPGYQFALQQGENAVQSSAAANGSLLTGGTMAALNNYAQGVADTNYNNVYNRALQGYDTNYNVWANNQANEFNRLASMAGMGQTTAGQLSNAGLASAGQVGATLGNTGNAIAQQNSNAAAATASGYVGAANAYGGALSGATGSLSQMLMMQQLLNQQGGGTTGFPSPGSNGSVDQLYQDPALYLPTSI